MKISEEQVRQVALLARVGLTDEEALALRQQLETILDYVAQLAELDLEGVEGTSHALALDCPLRPDQRRASTPTERIVEPAPFRQGDFFAVPRILPD